MVRKATITDVALLAQLFDAYRVYYDKESDIKGAEDFLNERIRNKESVIYVAVDGGKLVGFVQLYPIYSSTRMKRLWLLNDLYVDTNYRSKGIGELLLEKSKKFAVATNSCGLQLETVKINSKANNLYIKNEWELDIEHNFYSWNSNK